MKNRLTVLALAGLLLACAGDATLPSAPARSPHTEARHLSLAQFLTQPIPDDAPNAPQVRRGQYLVRLGDCASCHTPEGGAPLAGSFGLRTPFGVIYSTNLTSDAQTGIGRLSGDQFYNALHHGVGPRGGNIYPAMPYNYFTRVTRADSDAILAYLKTTPPVSARRPPNRLTFPLNFRELVRAWNALYFREAEFAPNPAHSPERNRGAYIVTGLGHCGSCHTPKTALAGDEDGRALHGGELDNWVAPDLTPNTRTGLGAWSTEEIVQYLRTGRNAHANAGGPMADVVTNSTSLMTTEDLRAVAVYLASQAPSPTPRSARPNPQSMLRGHAIYSDGCSSCHMIDGGGQPGAFAPLVGNAVAQQSNPAGLTHIILAGSRTGPTPTRPSPLSMPSFAWKLSDQEIADVSTYIRNSWGNQAPPVERNDVASMRRRLGLTTIHRTDNSGDSDFR
jgi:mono/diheme cytochrome c family protein